MILNKLLGTPFELSMMKSWGNDAYSNSTFITSSSCIHSFPFLFLSAAISIRKWSRQGSTLTAAYINYPCSYEGGNEDEDESSPDHVSNSNAADKVLITTANVGDSRIVLGRLVDWLMWYARYAHLLFSKHTLWTHIARPLSLVYFPLLFVTTGRNSNNNNNNDFHAIDLTVTHSINIPYQCEGETTPYSPSHADKLTHSLTYLFTHSPHKTGRPQAWTAGRKGSDSPMWRHGDVARAS